MSSNSLLLDIRTFVYQWNAAYPLDKWWRTHYNIPFGSEAHLNQSIVDIRIDYEEKYVYAKHASEQTVEKYQINSGDWLKESVEDIVSDDELFDAIDIDTLNESTDDFGRQIIET